MNQGKYRIMIALSCLFLGIGSGNIFGQISPGIVAHQQIVWLSYDNRMEIGEGWKIRTELESRRFLTGFRSHQDLLPRISLMRDFKNGIGLAAGGTFFIQYFPQNEGVPVDHSGIEIRPHQDFNLDQKLGNLLLTHRYRLEERIFLPQKAGDPTLFRLRFRYLFQGQFFLIPGKRFGGKLAAEIHLHVGDGVNQHYFDQSRLYGGLFWKFSPAFKVDLGYLNWFQQLSDGNHYYFRNIIRLGLTHQFSLRKKDQ